MYIIINFSSQGKREKKSSKKLKKAAAAAVEDDQPSETGAGGGASGGGGGGAAELFDLDIGSQQKQEPVSRFQVLAEDENLKMVGTRAYQTTYSTALSFILWEPRTVSCGKCICTCTVDCPPLPPAIPLATEPVNHSTARHKHYMYMLFYCVILSSMFDVTSLSLSPSLFQTYEVRANPLFSQQVTVAVIFQ